jgi:hypothetical protein
VLLAVISQSVACCQHHSCGAASCAPDIDDTRRCIPARIH